jgi:hypothetical protein
MTHHLIADAVWDETPPARRLLTCTGFRTEIGPDLWILSEAVMRHRSETGETVTLEDAQAGPWDTIPAALWGEAWDRLTDAEMRCDPMRPPVPPPSLPHALRRPPDALIGVSGKETESPPPTRGDLK